MRFGVTFVANEIYFMTSQEIAEKTELTELSNKLFMYVDASSGRNYCSKYSHTKFGLIWQMKKQKIYLQQKFVKYGDKVLSVRRRTSPGRALSHCY